MIYKAGSDLSEGAGGAIIAPFNRCQENALVGRLALFPGEQALRNLPHGHVNLGGVLKTAPGVLGLKFGSDMSRFGTRRLNNGSGD